MALSTNTLAALEIALASTNPNSQLCGDELAAAIVSGQQISTLTTQALQIALCDTSVAADMQAAILGTQKLSAFDLVAMTQAFPSADPSGSAVGEIAATLGVAANVPLPQGYNLPSGFTVTPTRNGTTQQSSTAIAPTAGSTLPSTGPSAAIALPGALGAINYYVYYTVIGGTNTVVIPAGYTGVQIFVAPGATAMAIATATQAALAPLLVGSTATQTGSVVTVATASDLTSPAAPSVAPGTYSSSQSVSLSSSTPGASIYYTIDGSTPTTSSTPYVSPFTIGVSLTLRTLTVAPGFAPVFTTGAYVISVTPGVATHISWTTQPSTAQAGVAFATQPIITIQDSTGATVTTGADATATITITLLTGTGTLGGTVTKTAIAGVADFSGQGLEVSLYGNKVLRATKSVTTTGAFTADSNTLNISNTLAAVPLGTSANYVILAESGISTTSGTAIVGNIAVSPIAHTAITGFTYTPNLAGAHGSATEVTGNVDSPDNASPTPSYLTTAVANMGTAYTNAQGRVTPDFTNLGGGNIGGLTLTPGLYNWTTGVTIPTSCTFSGGPNDIWIMQVAGTFDISAATSIILSGGAVATNIFWAVAGSVTIETTAVFQGIMLGQTNIAVQTGASVTGRLLAQTAVTLQSNSIVA
jgi:hypothetical protein